MKPAEIVNIVSIALEVLEYFIDSAEDIFAKVKLPKTTKAKITLIREQNKAKKKFLGELE